MITLIVKVSSSCTLKCAYCYYLDASHTTQIEHMSEVVLEKTISSRLSLEGQDARFIWHGGEPLMVGLDFYEKVVRLEQQYQRTGQKVINSLQTNGTLLTDSWANFFKNHDFKIGVSLDGPERIHNRYRNYPSGQGSFREVMAGIEALRKVDANFGILTVITKDSLPYAEEIYRFFVTHGLKAVDFLPHAEIDPLTGKMRSNSITPQEFYGFMLQVFKLWFGDNDPNIHIRTFENMLSGLLGGRPTLCKFAGTCSEFLTVQPNGDVYPDDNFTGFMELKLGNLLYDTFETIMQKECYQKFALQVSERKPQCLKCEWYPICHGGCSYRRYMLKQNFNDEEYFCETWKALFKFMSEQIQSTLGRVPFFGPTEHELLVDRKTVVAG